MNSGERRALLHYLVRGYRPLETNAWAGGHELDLVVRRGGTLVFVEVKEKRGRTHGSPVEQADAQKLRRVRRAAAAWLARHPELRHLDVRVDVVGVRGRRVDRVVAD